MYRSFVSFDKLEELLAHLLVDGLLEQEKGEMTYLTTQKGLNFLGTLNQRNTNTNHIFMSSPIEDDGNTCAEQHPSLTRSGLDTISQTNSSQNINSQPTFDELVSFDKVLVIGLGQLGLPVAKYVKDRGFDVYGFDISTKALQRAEKTAGIKRAINFSGFDVYIICVSTHKQEDMFSPQIDGILSIVRDKISKEAKNGALVSIESTIPKGTSKKVFEMLNHRLHVAHAPHRWYALEEKEHGVNQLRVVGGVCDCCLRVAMQFYDGSQSHNSSFSSLSTLTLSPPQSSPSPQSSSSSSSTELELESQLGASSDNEIIERNKKPSLGIPMHPVPEIETAELTKIIENAHRYLQIAFAEDLYLYCQANNINFAELRDSLNTKWNVNILEPREGIGGHCLPKDTKMFLNSSKSIKSKILEAAIEVDYEYRRYRQNSKLQEIVIEENNKPAVVRPAAASVMV
jgi:UDP-N-acetyl-D-mannosaminuronate dehydrogenase